jgi:hypothetical protein
MIARLGKLLIGLCLAVASVDGVPAMAADHGPPPTAPSKDGKGIQIRLDPLVVSLMRNGAVEKHVGFVIVLEVADAATQVQVQDKMAKLTDAFVIDINALASLPNAADTGIDPEAFKRRLTASCARIVGPDTIRNIVFLRTFTRKVS